MRRLTSSFDHRHPLAMALVRFAVGLWLLVLAGLLSSIHDWAGALLIVPAALLFWIGYSLMQTL